MENIFTDEYGKFSNRTKPESQIDSELLAVYPDAHLTDTPTIYAHTIAAEILKIAHGSEFEIFNSESIHNQIVLLNNLIIIAEITDTEHLTRIIKFTGSDYAYIHHLIGHGFHEILNQI